MAKSIGGRHLNANRWHGRRRSTIVSSVQVVASHPILCFPGSQDQEYAMSSPTNMPPLPPASASGFSAATDGDPTPQGPTRRARPRLWTVFLTTIVAFVAMLLLSGLTALAFVLPVVLENPGSPLDAQALEEAIATPFAIFVQAIPGQGAILVIGLIAAYLSPERWQRRVGLVDSGLTTFEWWMAGFSSFVPAAIGLLLAEWLALVIHPDPTAATLFQQMSLGLAVPWVLFIALAPGFSEEILFRGYVQRRLLERWPPVVAIIVSSTLFAAFHILPHTIVFAFPIGLWFGVMAWKTGSIWPTILAHILINGTWNVLNISQSLVGFSDALYYGTCGLLLATGVVGCGISWPAMTRVATHRQSLPADGNLAGVPEPGQTPP